MKRIFILLCVLLLSMQVSAMAKIHQAQVSNVASIRSDFTYRDPALMLEYQKQVALNQDDDKSNDKSVKEPPAIFSIYVTKDRFYDEDKIDKYNERINLSVTSHDMDMNYIFDKKIPPYLILVDSFGNEKTLNFARVRYQNPFWISFRVSPKEITEIVNADSIKIALPELTDNIYLVNEQQTRIKKKDYDKKMEINWQIYEIPQDIVQEWRETLNADLSINK